MLLFCQISANFLSLILPNYSNRSRYRKAAKAASAAATQEGSDATDGVAARSLAQGAYP